MYSNFQRDSMITTTKKFADFDGEDLLTRRINAMKALRDALRDKGYVITRKDYEIYLSKDTISKINNDEYHPWESDKSFLKIKDLPDGVLL